MTSTAAGRVARTLARAPIRLYRGGYGWLLGHRCLMLQHTGRVTGLPRYVVLEVVDRLPGDRYVVAAGMGDGADWYRNVRANPAVRVWVGRRQGVSGVARVLDQDEARGHFETYRSGRPMTWRLLAPLISRLIGRPGQSDEELFTSVPLVELSTDAAG